MLTGSHQHRLGRQVKEQKRATQHSRRSYEPIDIVLRLAINQPLIRAAGSDNNQPIFSKTGQLAPHHVGQFPVTSRTSIACCAAYGACSFRCVATSSLFSGQQQVFPEALHETIYLELPYTLVLILLVFWLGKVFLGDRITKRKMQRSTVSKAT